MPNEIESQAEASLNKRVEQLSDNIEEQLAQIRRQALVIQPRTYVLSRFMFEKKYLVSAFSVLALTILFSSSLLNNDVSTLEQPLLTLNELSEDPELLDDLEFIYWLSQEHEEVLL